MLQAQTKRRKPLAGPGTRSQQRIPPRGVGSSLQPLQFLDRQDDAARKGKPSQDQGVQDPSGPQPRQDPQKLPQRRCAAEKGPAQIVEGDPVIQWFEPPDHQYEDLEVVPEQGAQDHDERKDAGHPEEEQLPDVTAAQADAEIDRLPGAPGSELSADQFNIHPPPLLRRPGRRRPDTSPGESRREPPPRISEAARAAAPTRSPRCRPPGRSCWQPPG